MSGNSTTGGWTEPDPYATLSYNRFQSGWVATDDVVIADGSYQAVTLRPHNVAGTQLFAIKTAQPGRFYVLGARTTSTYDPIPSAWQGVEVYEVDYYCDDGVFGGGICPGIYRTRPSSRPATAGSAMCSNRVRASPGGSHRHRHRGDSYRIHHHRPTPTPIPTARPHPGSQRRRRRRAGDAQLDRGRRRRLPDPQLRRRGGEPGRRRQHRHRCRGDVVEDDDRARTTAPPIGRSDGRPTPSGTGPGRHGHRTSPLAPYPTAPGIPTATAGPASISAVWTAPGDNGGAAISNYRLEVNDMVASTNSYLDVGTTLSKNITGLVNGDTYRIRVRAENSFGPGVWSGWSSQPHPDLDPERSAQPGDHRHRGWGGDRGLVGAGRRWWAAVTGYEVGLENATGGGTVTYHPGTARAQLVGIVRGRYLPLPGAGGNSEGWGAWSAWSPDFIPGPVPSAPGVPTVIGGRWTDDCRLGRCRWVGSAVDTYAVGARGCERGPAHVAVGGRL